MSSLPSPGTTRRCAWGDAARREHDAAAPYRELLVADLDYVLALEDVEDLVLTLVDVPRRVDHRRHLLEERERAAGRFSRRPDEDRHVAEDEALARVRLEREGRKRGHAGRG
jgi:hypothetical protein